MDPTRSHAPSLCSSMSDVCSEHLCLPAPSRWQTRCTPLSQTHWQPEQPFSCTSSLTISIVTGTVLLFQAHLSLQVQVFPQCQCRSQYWYNYAFSCGDVFRRQVMPAPTSSTLDATESPPSRRRRVSAILGFGARRATADIELQVGACRGAGIASPRARLHWHHHRISATPQANSDSSTTGREQRRYY
jgi:hypothetical protein